MRMLIAALLWGMVLLGQTASALEVELRYSTTGEVWASNAQARPAVEVYLVWYNADTAQVYTWDADGWRPGARPIGGGTLQLPAFAPIAVAPLPAACAEEHACVLGALVLAPGGNPADPAQWLDSSVVPLSVRGAQLRLPGQSVFVQPVGESDYVPRPPVSALEQEAVDTSITSGAPGIIEKPDIYKLEGSQLLYANASARRFQVVDLANPTAPRLLAEYALAGEPREVYRLHEYYGVVQSLPDGNTEVTLLSLADDKLNLLRAHAVPGYLLESRRRGEVLYAVIQAYETGQAITRIHALRLGPAAEVTEVARAELPVSNPVVRIFPDYLLLAGPSPLNGDTSAVQVYGLADPARPLRPAQTLSLPGWIPSEFHLDVNADQLRVVYGGRWNSAAGSSLAVYDLALFRAGAGDALPPLGRLDGIAPGEALFATRFDSDYAYVVTYLRTDPLWVIDLSDPRLPTVRGELHVPGWSEQLFFHQGRLFGFGIDDQPAPGEETWTRRVSASLFDVSDPTQPGLLGRVTPLLGQSNYSWAPALEDERALWLDWDNQYAAFPLETWFEGQQPYLQILGIEPAGLRDAGLLALPNAGKRALGLGDGLLGVFGDQRLMTVGWDPAGGTPPHLLGEVELARNLAWLRDGGDSLWAAARNDKGYYSRLYRYGVDNLAREQQSWNLPGNYDHLALDGALALSYDYDPPRLQALDTARGELYPAQKLTLEPDSYLSSIRAERGQVYLTEQHVLNQPALQEAASAVGERYTPAYYGVLRVGRVEGGVWAERASYSLPGDLRHVFDGDVVVASEANERGELRLNLLKLLPQRARLLHSVELPCTGYSDVQGDGDVLYVNCGWYLSPSFFAEAQTVYRFGVVGERLQQQGRWQLPLGSGRVNLGDLRAVKQEWVVVGGSYYYFPPYGPGFIYADTCLVYQLRPGAEAELKLELPRCQTGERLVLTPSRLYHAEGFAGITVNTW